MAPLPPVAAWTGRVEIAWTDCVGRMVQFDYATASGDNAGGPKDQQLLSCFHATPERMRRHSAGHARHQLFEFVQRLDIVFRRQQRRHPFAYGA